MEFNMRFILPLLALSFACLPCLAMEDAQAACAEDRTTSLLLSPSFQFWWGAEFEPEMRMDRTLGRDDERAFLLLPSMLWRREAFSIDRIKWRDSRGVRLTGKGTDDRDRNQNHWCETTILDLLNVGVRVYSREWHLVANVSLGIGRQRIVQNIGGGSYFKYAHERSESHSILTDWGFEAGAEFEYASTDPIDPVEVAICNPVTVVALIFIGGQNGSVDSNPLGALGLLGGLGKRDSFRVHLTDDLRCLFGFSLGYKYLNTGFTNEKLFGRTLSGTWEYSEPSATFFTGLYIGNWGVLKTGGEWLGSMITADLTKRGSGPESLEIKEEYKGSGWGFFAEFSFLGRHLPGFFLKASTAGGGSVSAGIGLTL